MKVAVRNDHSVVISDLLEQHLAFLVAVPVVIALAARPPWDSDPVVGDGDPAFDDLREDWKLIVQPELRAHCEHEIDILLGDVAGARAQGGADVPPVENVFHFLEGSSHEIFIPRAHVEPWYGALNQARLALESIHGFSARLLDEADDWPVEMKFAFWQYRIYSAFQEGLLTSMENQFDAGQDENPAG